MLNLSRVALTPAITASLVKKGFQVKLEHGAGVNAKFRDAEYEANGAKVTNHSDVFESGEYRQYSTKIIAVEPLFKIRTFHVFFFFRRYNPESPTTHGQRN